MLVAPQPRTRVAMGPEVVRTSVCLTMAKEAVALHRLRPGPSGFAILEIADAKARLAHRKWRDAAQPSGSGEAQFLGWPIQAP